MTPEAASAWTAIGTAGGGRASVASTRSCGCQSAWLLRCPAGRRRPRRCACCHGGDGGRGCCPPCSHAYVRCGRGRPRPAARAHRLHSRCCQQTPEPANAPSCLVSNQRCAPCLWHLACARSTGWIPPPPVAPPETAAARQQLHSTNAIAQASAETMARGIMELCMGMEESARRSGDCRKGARGRRREGYLGRGGGRRGRPGRSHGAPVLALDVEGADHGARPAAEHLLQRHPPLHAGEHLRPAEGPAATCQMIAGQLVAARLPDACATGRRAQCAGGSRE